MKAFPLWILPLVSCLSPLTATAGTISGLVTGTWMNPVLAGPVINLDGTTTVLNNSTTAFYSATPSNDLRWGTNTFAPPPSIYSGVIFQGSSLSNVPTGLEVLLGTITFLNGTSQLDSLLFGATLRISVPADPTVTPFDALMTISTTVNGGTCIPCDADFIRLTNVDILSTMNVNEGATATFNVYGKFVGDPLISLTRYTVASGSTGGFVGNGQPADIPEPASAALVAGGLIAIVATARTRRPA